MTKDAEGRNSQGNCVLTDRLGVLRDRGCAEDVGAMEQGRGVSIVECFGILEDPGLTGASGTSYWTSSP